MFLNEGEGLGQAMKWVWGDVCIPYEDLPSGTVIAKYHQVSHTINLHSPHMFIHTQIIKRLCLLHDLPKQAQEWSPQVRLRHMFLVKPIVHVFCAHNLYGCMIQNIITLRTCTRDKVIGFVCHLLFVVCRQHKKCQISTSWHLSKHHQTIGNDKKLAWNCIARLTSVTNRAFCWSRLSTTPRAVCVISAVVVISAHVHKLTGYWQVKVAKRTCVASDLGIAYWHPSLKYDAARARGAYALQSSS